MVKVEMKKEEGRVFLSFEGSGVDDHETLDAIRVAIFSDLPKQGKYLNSNIFALGVLDPNVSTIEGSFERIQE